MNSQANSSLQQSTRPPQIQALNWVGWRSGLEKSNRVIDLRPASLMKSAEKQSGLSDWGDGAFHEPLTVFTDALMHEANLNLVGRYNFRIECIRLLINRLQFIDYRKQHPEVADVAIQRPLFVVGMFRSGTTFLHNLLAEDPTSRWLHTAEAMFPYPPPEKATWQADPRIQKAAKRFQFQESLASKFVAAHRHSMSRPEECSKLIENGFIGHLFDLRANVPSYSAWLQKQDLTSAYVDFRHQLQCLASRWDGQHWVLKAPAHIFAIDALLNAFPDANIVHIHREPSKSVASLASLCAMSWSRYSDQVDLKRIGSHMLDLMSDGVRQALAARTTANQHHFFDVQYADMIANPLETVRQIYSAFDYNLTPALEANLDRWLSKNPQHKHGRHRYAMTDFGLSVDQINGRFEPQKVKA